MCCRFWRACPPGNCVAGSADLSLRFRMDDAEGVVEAASTEVRFKVRLPGSVIRGGRSAAFSWLDAVASAFAEILRSPELALLTEDDDAPFD